MNFTQAVGYRADIDKNAPLVQHVRTIEVYVSKQTCNEVHLKYINLTPAHHSFGTTSLP